MAIRRLSCILATDIVGFSSLMERNEEGTTERVRTWRQTVAEPCVAAEGGRIFKATGDGFLAEFASPLAAIRAALAVQSATAAMDGTSPFLLRIGANLGDVIVEPDGDLFGEGVNIAARIEQIASPGAILISGKVHAEVAGKVDVQFEDRGEVAVKNIVRPVRIFQVTRPGEAPRIGALDPRSLEDRPSIAVLPFTNMSDDKEQEYFADGLAEDIITALSRIQSFYVIARNSSFTYKGRAVDVKQVGRELGVRYVLEGSVRKSSSRLRITGQLIDASTGHHLWADRFDGDLQDVFDLQDQITDAIVGAIEPTLRDVEVNRSRSKNTQSLQAYDLCLQALPNINLMISKREDNDRAMLLLFKAIALDPDYALGKALAAFATVLRKSQHWSTPDEDEAGIRLAEEALSHHRDHPVTLACAGHALAYLGRRYDVALRTMDRALEAGRNSWRVLTSNAWVRNYVGEGDAALLSFERCMRLNPLDPELGFSLSGLATACLITGRFEEALKHGRASVDAAPTWATSYRTTIFALV